MSENMKCPGCGGSVYYDPKSGKMKCFYCSEEMDIDEFSKQEKTQEENPGVSKWAKMQQELDAISQEEKMIEEEMNDEYIDLHLYRCTNCGAQLMLSGTEASTFCGFCNSPTIMFDRVSKELRPKKIIPFKITKKQALNRIKESFDNGKYVPKKICSLTEEDVRGIYIPFWLYNCFIRRGMRIETWVEDKGKVAFFRDASCRFTNLTLDASLSLSNELSQRLEPYDMDELVDFEEAYLSGFYADKFDVPRKAVESIARDRCRKYLDKIILSSVPTIAGAVAGDFEPFNYEKKNVKEDYRVIDIEYALLPAYFVNVSYKEGDQLLMVNGQTGKVVGSLPVEKEQLMKAFIPNAIGCSIFFTVFSVVLCLLLPKTIPFLIVLIIIAIGSLIGGNYRFKKYKMDWYRLNASSLRKYVNNRENSQ